MLQINLGYYLLDLCEVFPNQFFTILFSLCPNLKPENIAELLSMLHYPLNYTIAAKRKKYTLLVPRGACSLVSQSPSFFTSNDYIFTTTPKMSTHP